MEDTRPHALGGDLAQVPLASVLITALKQKISGELSIEHGQGQDQVYFQEGVPTGTHVLHAFKPLGRLLLEMGWIDMEALDRSLDLMSKGRRQGEALLEIGALDQVQLNAGLRMLQIRNLVELAKLPRGSFHFDPEKPAPTWACGVPANVLKTLREVLAVPQSRAVCHSLFKRLGGEEVPVRIPEHLLQSLSHFELDAEEDAAARLLVQPQTLKEFFAASKLPKARSLALAAELSLTGIAVTYDSGEDTGKLGNRAVSPEREEAALAREHLDDLVQEIQRAAESPAPQTAPPRQGSGDDSPAPQTAPSRQSSGDDGKARRRRLLHRAIANVGPQALSRAVAPEAQPQMPPEPAHAPEPTFVFDMVQGVVLDPGGPDPEEVKLQALIEERASMLPRQDLFGHLGLTRDATSEDVKRAFLEAVKIFHPDHLPPGLSFLAEKQRELFGALKRAYDTLSDDDRRKHYLELLNRSGNH
jgi:hypothetical protein